jgi:hypothetical protein
MCPPMKATTVMAMATMMLGTTLGASACSAPVAESASAESDFTESSGDESVSRARTNVIEGEVLGIKLDAKSVLFNEGLNAGDGYSMALFFTDVPSYCGVIEKNSSAVVENQTGFSLIVRADDGGKERPRIGVEYATGGEGAKKGFQIRGQFVHLDDQCKPELADQLSGVRVGGTVTFTEIGDTGAKGKFKFWFEDTVDMANGTVSGELAGAFDASACDARPSTATPTCVSR